MPACQMVRNHTLSKLEPSIQYKMTHHAICQLCYHAIIVSSSFSILPSDSYAVPGSGDTHETTTHCFFFHFYYSLTPFIGLLGEKGSYSIEPFRDAIYSVRVEREILPRLRMRENKDTGPDQNGQGGCWS